jgi:hypothetical protein
MMKLESFFLLVNNEYKLPEDSLFAHLKLRLRDKRREELLIRNCGILRAGGALLSRAMGNRQSAMDFGGGEFMPLGGQEMYLRFVRYSCSTN